MWLACCMVVTRAWDVRIFLYEGLGCVGGRRKREGYRGERRGKTVAVILLDLLLVFEVKTRKRSLGKGNNLNRREGGVKGAQGVLSR